MALIYSVNQLPGSGAAALYALIQHLVSAGWTVRAAGDGISAYSASNGTAVTHSGAGANGFNNYKAWYRLRMPGTDSAPREIVIQRGSNATDARVKYSAGAAFSGGSPSATQCSTASNEQVLISGGTDALPTGTNLVGTINRVSMWADNAAPYGFGMVGWSAAGAITFGLALEPMASGSYPSEDADPYVWAVHPNAATFGNVDNAWSNTGVTTTNGWYKYGLTGAAWVGIWATRYAPVAGAAFAPNASGAANPYSGKDDELPLLWGRGPALSTPGLKGFGQLMRLTWATRPSLSTLSVASAGAKDRLVINQVSIPWSGVDPLL